MILHPLLQTIRGMCADELPYPVIDAQLAEAVDRAKDLEDALRKLCDWGYGENAPDLAKRDWQDVRALLANERRAA